MEARSDGYGFATDLTPILLVHKMCFKGVSLPTPERLGGITEQINLLTLRVGEKFFEVSPVLKKKLGLEESDKLTPTHSKLLGHKGRHHSKIL